MIKFTKNINFKNVPATKLNIDFITPTTPVTFTQYHELLVNADWFHDFSDSISVSSLGCGREGQLRGIAKRHDFAAYMFSHFCDVRNSAIQGGDVVKQSLVQLKANWANMTTIKSGGGK